MTPRRSVLTPFLLSNYYQIQGLQGSGIINQILRGSSQEGLPSVIRGTSQKRKAFLYIHPQLHLTISFAPCRSRIVNSKRSFYKSKMRLAQADWQNLKQHGTIQLRAAKYARRLS